MSRYIDADALDDSFRDSIVKCKQWFEEALVLREEESTARAEQAYVTFMECSMRLKEQPTVDAVPVVRCKDCIEYRDSVGACHYFNYEPTDEMDFCSHGIRVDGERRTDEQQT